MKYISVIEDTIYLLWQQELQVYNFRKLGIVGSLVVVVLHNPGQPISNRALKLADTVEVHYFPNDQVDRSYPPSNKPFGVMRLLQKAPWYGRRLLLIDSDVILRAPIDTSRIDGSIDDPTWYVSDSGVVSFIGHRYLAENLGDVGAREMAALVGLSDQRLMEVQQHSGGAHYFMKHVTSAFFRQVTDDALKIWHWSQGQKRDDGTNKIQNWTAEMWAMIWNAFRVAPVEVSPELNFCWAPFQLSAWHECKILHMAGVTDASGGAFYKGSYMTAAPWEVERDFIHIDRSKCWAPYVELIEEYAGTLNAPEPPANPAYRAIVAYVDDRPDLIQQASALYQSLLYCGSQDTDLVLFGPAVALNRIPDGPRLVKLVQAPHPLAHKYGFINSLSCFNGVGSEVLDRYQRILKTDVDTFLTPAWNSFYPSRFTCGRGGYSNTQNVVDRCKRLAENKGLQHKGWHNLGSTLWGETSLVKNVCRLATELTEYLIEKEFAETKGEWPDWYWGVASMYATEVAVNHLVGELEESQRDQLDFHSTSADRTEAHPHIHCWHTFDKFSKFRFQEGAYQETEEGLDLSVTHDYCLAMSLRGKKAIG